MKKKGEKMNNFQYWNPVKMIFGKGQISSLSTEIPKNKKVLVVYGGGSIKKNGVYDQVKSTLDGYEWDEFSGIQPNPTFEKSMEAVEKIRAESFNFILAVGGGSVLDACKFIAAAVHHDDPEKILRTPGLIMAPKALSIGAVLTLPATGSEMNCFSVVSMEKTDEKLSFASPNVYPLFSVFDPETTYTLPERQTINGIVDAYVHVLEQYATKDNSTPLQNRQAESILQTLKEQGPKVLETHSDYDARANIGWCATNALNGLIGQGCIQDWSTHMIGHELTAFYGVDHAQSLAIVLFGVWEYCFKQKKERLAQYAERVFGVKGLSEEDSAREAIKLTEEFFNSINMKSKLSDYGINAKEAAEKISERFKQRKTVVGENGNINYEAVKEILLNRA